MPFIIVLCYSVISYIGLKDLHISTLMVLSLKCVKCIDNNFNTEWVPLAIETQCTQVNSQWEQRSLLNNLSRHSNTCTVIGVNAHWLLFIADIEKIFMKNYAVANTQHWDLSKKVHDDFDRTEYFFGLFLSNIVSCILNFIL